MDNNVLAFSGNNGGSYIYDGLYESYIQAKIDSEDRLAFVLKEAMVISEADYSNIRALQEATLGDKIKSKWQKFIAFIKRMAAKFLESMNNLLLDEKSYLEKYKDIILKKKPKDSMEYSYTGNYENGIKRLINTEIPLFNYTTYKKELEAEGEGDLANKITPSDFRYTDGDSLSEQFKNYFLDLDAGQQEGKFSSLRMIDLYNFCYNFNKIKGIVDKDINRLEASTRAIEAEIKKQLDASTNTVTNQQSSTTQTSGNGQTNNQQGNNNQNNTNQQGNNGQTNNNQQSSNNQTSQNASAILRTSLNSFNEADENKSDNTNLQIKASTDPTSKMGSTSERNSDDEKNQATTDANTAKGENKEANEISQAADKWINVCRCLISAKLTACQQIAKDYMEIIRAHVRSYGGTDKKSKEGNTSPGKGKEYIKDKEKEANDKAEQEAKKADQAYKNAQNNNP